MTVGQASGERRTMRVAIGCLTVLCGLAGINICSRTPPPGPLSASGRGPGGGVRQQTLNADLAADEPRPSEAVTILHDIRYREGSSKQWRLDLAFKKNLRGKPRPGIVVIHG